MLIFLIVADPNESGYSFAADWFSTGIVLVEMAAFFCGKDPRELRKVKTDGHAEAWYSTKLPYVQKELAQLPFHSDLLCANQFSHFKSITARLIQHEQRERLIQYDQEGRPSTLELKFGDLYRDSCCASEHLPKTPRHQKTAPAKNSVTSAQQPPAQAQALPKTPQGKVLGRPRANTADLIHVGSSFAEASHPTDSPSNAVLNMSSASTLVEGAPGHLGLSQESSQVGFDSPSLNKFNRALAMLRYKQEESLPYRLQSSIRQTGRRRSS